MNRSPQSASSSNSSGERLPTLGHPRLEHQLLVVASSFSMELASLPRWISAATGWPRCPAAQLLPTPTRTREMEAAPRELSKEAAAASTQAEGARERDGDP
nr:unnamed protein product [Digitaria exilis]